MAKLPKYKIITFPLADTKNGILTMFQINLPGAEATGIVPFQIKKVLSITGMKSEDARGGHTHHKTQQILICTNGRCIVDLDDGKNKASVVLDKPNKGLLLFPYVWHVMRDFKENTSLLVIADTEYDEKDYIRKYEDFIQQLPKNLQG
jgi:dTDP-4-dehydrorhamnose 3,5-epimerase-like enzyme